MMKKVVFSIFAFTAIAGCQSNGQNSPSYTKESFFSSRHITKFSDEDCSLELYTNLSGPEFTYVKEDKYLLNYFAVTYDSSNYRYGIDAYAPLKGVNFKFTGRIAPKDPYISKSIKVAKVNSKFYSFDTSVYSQVVTENCDGFWFRGARLENSGSVKFSAIKRTKGKDELTVSDISSIYGNDNVKEYSPKATISIDKFEKSATITTEYSEDLLLRAFTDSELKSVPEEIQIYTEVSLLDWAHFDRAISDDGKERKLTKIDTNISNCGSSYGCTVSETVGITVPLSYVEKNRGGFEVQVYGNQKRVVRVPGYHIQAMLDKIAEISASQ